MKIIGTLWFTERGSATPIGIVLVQTKDGEKAYIGTGTGVGEEQTDAYLVAQRGAHFPVDLAKQLINKKAPSIILLRKGKSLTKMKSKKKTNKHIDGPWTVGDAGPEWWVQSPYGPVYTLRKLSLQGEANADLIAAAPDLLEMLKSASTSVCSLQCPSVKKTGEEWTHGEECRAITALIVKAEGR